jgi:hypothetical protein
MSVGYYNTNLPPDLRVLKDEIEGYARGTGSTSTRPSSRSSTPTT